MILLFAFRGRRIAVDLMRDRIAVLIPSVLHFYDLFIGIACGAGQVGRGEGVKEGISVDELIQGHQRGQGDESDGDEGEHHGESFIDIVEAFVDRLETLVHPPEALVYPGLDPDDGLTEFGVLPLVTVRTDEVFGEDGDVAVERLLCL
jgi:hypothetical protein